ncbi:MAG: hypothetical protein N4A43_04865 [Alphaproteobacteria bacterium]|jgi:hypothetical protein|nr:hypothetical protein [Alphaproteobacteria bacterium]
MKKLILILSILIISSCANSIAQTNNHLPKEFTGEWTSYSIRGHEKLILNQDDAFYTGRFKDKTVELEFIKKISKENHEEYNEDEYKTQATNLYVFKEKDINKSSFIAYQTYCSKLDKNKTKLVKFRYESQEYLNNNDWISISTYYKKDSRCP